MRSSIDPLGDADAEPVADAFGGGNAARVGRQLDLLRPDEQRDDRAKVLADCRGAARGGLGVKLPASLSALATLATLVVGGPRHAAADVVAPGSLGLVAGGQSGASGSYTSLGIGFAFGLTAAWQPMEDEQRIGWGVRWSTLFGFFPGSASAPVSGMLRLVEMDLVARLRVAPTLKPGRYLTIGAGASLLRANEPIEDERSFVGPIVTFGYEHYAFGAVLLGVDVRYGIIETGPTSIGLLLSIGTAL